MKTIETTVTIAPDGNATLKVPADVPPGDHRAVLILEDRPSTTSKGNVFNIPVISVGAWPAHLSLHREDMYGDDGR